MKIVAIALALLLFLAALTSAAAASSDWDRQYPTASTSDCKVTIFAGTFLGTPFTWTLPDADGLYPPCLILTCMYTSAPSRHCALQIMRPGTLGELLVASKSVKYRTTRVCLFDPTYGKVTFNADASLRALGYCDV